MLEAQSTTLEPQCCGDLANLDEWRRAAELKAPDWEMLWIGHPWAFVRAEGDRLWFSEPAEAPPVDGTALITVNRDALLAAIEEAGQTLDTLKARLEPRLARRMSATAAAAISATLAASG